MPDEGEPGPGGEGAAPGGFYRLAWGFYLVLAIAGVSWVAARSGEIPLGLFVDRRSWWVDVALGAAAGAALVAVWEVGRRSTVAVGELEEHLRGMLAGLDPAETQALALLSGFAEELFFRGAMQSAWGWGWAAVVFTALHVGPGVTYRVWTAFAFVAGLLFAGLTLWRGNILAAVVAHVLVNAVNLRRLARGRVAE